MQAFIVGSGTALPERVVSNEDIAGRLGLDPDQIFKSSGIKRRRWAEPGTTTSSLASTALELALTDANLSGQEIDYLIFGTMTPDRFIPGSAPSVQQKLGLAEIPCLDVRAACCNALYALQLASSLIVSGTARRVAICLAEVQSAWLDLSPEAGTTSMLFGDGASAIVVSNEYRDSALQIVDVLLATNGSYVDDLGIRCPGTEFGVFASEVSAGQRGDCFPRMVGQSVILQASRKMSAACQSILQRNDLNISDVRWIVPHQANANLLNQVARSLRFERGAEGLVSVLEDQGNTSSASMGLALDSLRRSNRIQAGDLLLMPAFGAGFSWGAALCRASKQ